MLFSSFPKLEYTFANEKTVVVADIFKKISLTQSTLENETLFETYILSDGVSPEKVSFDYYKNPKYSWVLFLANQIIDPHLDWPMEYSSYLNYLSTTYQGSSFFTWDLPNVRDGDVMVNCNPTGTSIDTTKHRIVLEWRKEMRNLVCTGGSGIINGDEHFLFLRKVNGKFQIADIGTTNNVIQLTKKIVDNLNTPKYFYIDRGNMEDEVISPYRILNGSTLTNLHADPTSTSIAPGSYTDTTTLRNTVLYKYVTSSSFGSIKVKTLKEDELEKLYKKYVIKIPKPFALSSILELYNQALKTSDIGRNLSLRITI